MNRLFALTALCLFLGLDASQAQTSLHKLKSGRTNRPDLVCFGKPAFTDRSTGRIDRE